MAAGCDLNASLDKEATSRRRPLEVAVREDRIDAIEWLLANGANPRLGRPLVGAVHYEKSQALQLQMLELLLNAGADINQQYDFFDKEDLGFTVLDWAELYGAADPVIEFLKERGAEKAWSPSKSKEMRSHLAPRRIVP